MGKCLNNGLIAYKGFDKELSCRDVRFKVGETYHIDGPIELCERGFHACLFPLDVFSYYPPTDGARYCIVKIKGDINCKFAESLNDDEGELNNIEFTSEMDSKVACSDIEILEEITIDQLHKAADEYIAKRLNGDDSEHNSLPRSSASNSGNRSSASNSGNRSSASNSGNRSSASNSGDYSSASNSGYQSSASNSGYQSSASNSGDYSSASNSGDYSSASNSGNRSSASNSGYQSSALTTGARSYASVCKNSIAVSIGFKSFAKGDVGSYLVLVDWPADMKYDDFDNKFELHPVLVKVDGEKIKADTYYICIDGNIIEESEYMNNENMQ